MIIHIVGKFKFVINLLCWLLFAVVVITSVLSTALVPVIGFILIYVAITGNGNPFQIAVFLVLGIVLVRVGVEPLIDSVRNNFLFKVLKEWRI